MEGTALQGERQGDRLLVSAWTQEGDLVVSGRIAATGGLEVPRTVGLARVRHEHGDLGVPDRTRRPTVALRHGPCDRARGCRVDRAEVRREIELVPPIIVVLEALPEVEVNHNVTLGRTTHRVIDEGINRRLCVPIHGSLARTVPDDRGPIGVDRHPDRMILAGRQLPFAEQGGGTLLQGEQIEALPGLGDEHPGPRPASVPRGVGLDPDHVHIHAAKRVVRKRGVREQHTSERLAVDGGDAVILVAPARGEQDGGNEGHGDASRHRSLLEGSWRHSAPDTPTPLAGVTPAG